jgi:hypothetical protein
MDRSKSSLSSTRPRSTSRAAGSRTRSSSASLQRLRNLIADGLLSVEAAEKLRSHQSIDGRTFFWFIYVFYSMQHTGTLYFVSLFRSRSQHNCDHAREFASKHGTSKPAGPALLAEPVPCFPRDLDRPQRFAEWRGILAQGAVQRLYVSHSNNKGTMLYFSYPGQKNAAGYVRSVNHEPAEVEQVKEVTVANTPFSQLVADPDWTVVSLSRSCAGRDLRRSPRGGRRSSRATRSWLKGAIPNRSASSQSSG